MSKRPHDKVLGDGVTPIKHSQYDDANGIILSGDRADYVREIPDEKEIWANDDIRGSNDLKMNKDALKKAFSGFPSESMTILGYYDQANKTLKIIIPKDYPRPNDPSISIYNNSMVNKFLNIKPYISPGEIGFVDVHDYDDVLFDDAARTTYLYAILSQFYTNGISSPDDVFNEFLEIYRDNQDPEIEELVSKIEKFEDETTIKSRNSDDINLGNYSKRASVTPLDVGNYEFDQRVIVDGDVDEITESEENVLFLSNNFDDFFVEKLHEMIELREEVKNALDITELTESQENETEDERVDEDEYSEEIEIEAPIPSKVKSEREKKYTTVFKEKPKLNRAKARKIRELRKIKHIDQIEGGFADNKMPSDFDINELEDGISVELEHTDDPRIAREIAMDHLTEYPNYYQALEKMEKELDAKKERKQAKKDRRKGRPRRKSKKINLAKKTEKSKPKVEAKTHSLSSGDYNVEFEGTNFSAYAEDEEEANTIVGNTAEEIEDVTVERSEIGNEVNTVVTIEEADGDTTVLENSRDKRKN